MTYTSQRIQRQLSMILMSGRKRTHVIYTDCVMDVCECPGNLHIQIFTFWNIHTEKRVCTWRRVKHLITANAHVDNEYIYVVDYVKGIVNSPLLYFIFNEPFLARFVFHFTYRLRTLYNKTKNRRYFPYHDFICFHRKLKFCWPKMIANRVNSCYWA